MTHGSPDREEGDCGDMEVPYDWAWRGGKRAREKKKRSEYYSGSLMSDPLGEAREVGQRDRRGQVILTNDVLGEDGTLWKKSSSSGTGRPESIIMIQKRGETGGTERVAVCRERETSAY